MLQGRFPILGVMSVPAPHYLLFSEARGRRTARDAGEWRFVLESVDGRRKMEAADNEPDQAGDRLELLAVVRGLEALEQPSKVTLVTPSRYVVHGLRFGLEQWRENNWQWERFGELTSVKNRDLWQRLDQALRIHQIDCRSFEWDQPDDLAPPPPREAAEKPAETPRSGKRKIRVDRGHTPGRKARGTPKTTRWGNIVRLFRRLLPTS